MRKQSNPKSCNSRYSYQKKNDDNSASLIHCYSTEKKSIYQQLIDKNINHSQLINRNFLSLISNRSKAATERAHYNSKRVSQESFSAQQYYKQKIGPQQNNKKEEQKTEEIYESHNLSVSLTNPKQQFARQNDFDSKKQKLSPKYQKYRSMTRMEKKNDGIDIQCKYYQQNLYQATNMEKIVMQVQQLEEVIERQNKEIEELKLLNQNVQQLQFLEEQISKINYENQRLKEKCDQYEKRLEQYKIFETAIETKFKELIQENLKLNEIVYNAQDGSEHLFQKLQESESEREELRHQNNELMVLLKLFEEQNYQLTSSQSKKKKEFFNQENQIQAVQMNQSSIPLRQQINQMETIPKKKHLSKESIKDGKDQVELSKTLDRLKQLSSTLINHAKNIQ